MQNKGIEEDKKELNIITTTIREILQKDVKITDEEVYILDGRQYFAIENILQLVDQLENKVKELEKENTDIKEVYIRTAKHLDKKGMLELSEYMLAQIEATPTFTTWEEYTTWVSKQVIRDKIEEINKEIEKYIEYTERGIETDIEWVDNVADRQIIKALQELLEEK